MTLPERLPRFAERPRPGARVITIVSLTVTSRSLVFSNARCPGCGGFIMAVPGECKFMVRLLESKDDRSGEGRIAHCRHCGEVEVVELR